jgi:hypothetical protein
MGRAKDLEMEKDDNWNLMCAQKGWQCEICGDYPPRGKPEGWENRYCPTCSEPKD